MTRQKPVLREIDHLSPVAQSLLTKRFCSAPFFPFELTLISIFRLPSLALPRFFPPFFFSFDLLLSIPPFDDLI